MPLLCRLAEERKVRATQGIPLPNGKGLVRVGKYRRKEPPVHATGKGEKVRQELTRPAAMSVLCTPGVESSCKPANKREDCPSEPEGRTIEDSGDVVRR